MVLRSGIIIPFQFRDNKKLLMIGVPEENRDLSIWDLKNVVRAAFGIYNFEFRNKKIGFNIPDELLLNYLAQRHDLTNFVIEVGQALEDAKERLNVKETSSFTPSCTQVQKVPLSRKSHESSDEAIQNLTIPINHKTSQEAIINISTMQCNNGIQEATTPPPPPAKKQRITQVYSEHNIPETLTQSIDPMDIIPKSEHEESELDLRNARCEVRAHLNEQQQEPFFQNYAQNMLGHSAHQMAAQHYSAGNYNRFRIYEPLSVNTTCTACRCAPLKSNDENNGIIPAPHSNQSIFRHSSSNNSNNSPTQEPPYKIRHTLNSNELRETVSPANIVEEEDVSSHLHVEPKIDYDSISAEEDIQTLQNEGAVTSTAAAVYQQRVTEEQSPELHFERMQMQHEFYMQQQQQQHHHQQQLQQHMESLMQEGPGRQRKERMSKKQKEVYVTFLEQTPIMSEYKRNDPFLDIYWQKLTDILNSVPQGAIKSMSEWKQAFDNWRFRIYVYARFNSKVTGDDALNPKNFKPLTVTDKRAYSLWIRNPDTAPPDLDKMRNIFVNLDETQLE